MGRLVWLSFAPRHPYSPESDGRRGDAFDINHLYYVPLPCVVCTTDTRFVNAIRETGAVGSGQVVLLDEFNERVRANTVSSLVAPFRTPEQQREDWNYRAFLNWVDRGRPLGDDLRDWYEAEPVA
jgi:hypothetical protein